MENDTRKRKIGNVEEQERGKEEREMEEDDEEKIEKFFALIRSSRDLMRKGSIESKKKEEKKPEAASAAAAWNPSFQPEDFIQGIIDGSQASAGPSKAAEDEQLKQKKEEEGDNGLDLNLSL